MVRHPGNANLKLWYGNDFCGMPIQEDKAPFVLNYLDKVKGTIEKAVAQYSRVFAFRVDLRMPRSQEKSDSSPGQEVISRFFQSFKAKIRHNRSAARGERRYVHDSQVRYVWTCEHGTEGKPHYHVAFLLNYDAFNTLGDFRSCGANMFARLEEAWASALGVERKDVKGLVEIPANPCYLIRRNDSGSVAPFFYRASYLCKAATKQYGSKRHAFGCSRG